MKKNTIWSGYYKRKKRYWFTACILLSLVILLACIMMVYGNTIYMPGTVLEVLKGNETKGAAFTIKTLRLPRMLAAIFVERLLVWQGIHSRNYWEIRLQVPILSV